MIIPDVGNMRDGLSDGEVSITALSTAWPMEVWPAPLRSEVRPEGAGRPPVAVRRPARVRLNIDIRCR